MDLLVEHLGAAYNLARWLLRDHTEAEDSVQDAYLRALRYADTFRGEDGRAWLLSIVRTRCYERLKVRVKDACSSSCDAMELGSHAAGPESLLLGEERTAQLRHALEKLPTVLREVLVLREFEELSYGQIATVCEVPTGTVMSRLSRARQCLRQQFLGR